MIVINPPVVPAFVPGILSIRPEEAAVEWALRIARAAFSSKDASDSVEWLRCLQKYGERTTFVVHGPRPFAYAVLRPDEVTRTDWHKHFIVDDLSGVLEAAAMIARRVKLASTPKAGQ